METEVWYTLDGCLEITHTNEHTHTYSDDKNSQTFLTKIDLRWKLLI